MDAISHSIIILMVGIKFTVLDLAALPTASKRVCANMETKGVKHAAHALSINQFRGFGLNQLFSPRINSDITSTLVLSLVFGELNLILFSLKLILYVLRLIHVIMTVCLRKQI